MPRLVNLSEIDCDDSTQARVATDQPTVERYAERMKDGDKFPPVYLFQDGDGPLRVGDGFHRIDAARRAGRDSIEAEVRTGGKRDALKYSLEANGRHGLPHSNADRRRAIGLVLDDPVLSQLPDREIARLCGSTHPTVADVRRSRQEGGKFYHSGRLTDEGRAKLSELEAKLEPLMPAVKQFWCALTEVRDERLYRGTHDTFDEYLTTTFGADMPRKVLVFEKLVTGQEVSEADLDCFRKKAG